MKQFDFRAPGWNVVFGVGALVRLPRLLQDLGLQRPLILCTPGRAPDADALSRALSGMSVATFPRAAPHVPIEVVDDALRAAREAGADCTISIGGGSTTGLGKSLRLRGGLPQVAIPTTYAGSEMTNLWGITENRTKHTGRDAAVTPVLVVYDPELLVSLPRAIAGPSALNALAQAAANLPGFNDDPVPNLFAREATAVIGRGLRRLLQGSADVEACSQMLYGACMAGAALGAGRTGLHHRICHVLGGMFGLPHADTHAVILPYSLAFNRDAAPGALELIADALTATDAAENLHGLMRIACRRPSLCALGLSAADLVVAAEAVLATPIPGPAPVTGESVLRLLRSAFEGNPPD